MGEFGGVKEKGKIMYYLWDGSMEKRQNSQVCSSSPFANT